MIEVMLAMAILAVIAMVTYPLVNTMNRIRKSTVTYYQDETGVYQIQLLLAVNKIDEVSGDCISFHTRESECVLHIVNGKLISQPGTVDYIHGIDEVHFWQEGEIIYMEYERNAVSFIWPIGYRFEE